MNRAVLCSILFMLMILPFVPLRAQEIEIVCAESGYMPYYSADAKKGMFIDFITAFAKIHPQYSFTFVSVPRKRMSVMMENGSADIFSLNGSMFFDKEKYLCTTPIWKESSVLFMRKDGTFPFKKANDLFGKRIGTIAGNVYPELDTYFRDGTISETKVTTSSQLFKMLKAHRIDGFIGDRNTTVFRLKEEGFSDVIVCNSSPILVFDLTIQLQKKHQLLTDQLNAFIKESKSDGFLQSLNKMYLP